MSYDLLFIPGLLVHIILGILLVSTYIAYHKSKLKSSAGNILGIFSVVFFVMVILEFSWLFSFLHAQFSDLLFIYTIFSAAEAILMLLLVHTISDNQNLLYILAIYIFVLFGISLNIAGFLWLVFGLSHILLLLLFLDLTLFNNNHLKKAGFFGIAHSVIYVIILVLIALGYNSYLRLTFFPDILLIPVLLYFLADIKNNGIKTKHKKSQDREKSWLANLLFVRFILHVMTVCVFLFISIIAIHELGHAFTAQAYDCKYSKAVIYDVLNPPHTELSCPNDDNDVIITYAGLITTLLVSLLFFIGGGQFTSKAAYLMLGFSLLITYGDFSDLNVSGSIILFTILVSLFFICFGVVQLSLLYIDQHFQQTVEEQKSINLMASGGTK